MIRLTGPSIGDREINAAVSVLRSGLLTQGAQVASFEAEMQAYLAARRCVAVASGTAALELSLTACGIERGDHVVVPAFTFIATAAAVCRVGAVPVFADVDPATYCVDASTVRRVMTKQVKGVVPVHLFGYPAPVEEIQDAVGDDVVLIEDAAQALGAESSQGRVGGSGVAIFSFYPTKNVATGEGGLVATDNDSIAAAVALLRNQGMSSSYSFECIGTNERMSEVEAAIGRVQLERLEDFLSQREVIAKKYLEEIRTVTLPTVPQGGRHAWGSFTVRARDRDRLVNHLTKSGVESRVYYPDAISDLSIFGAPSGCPVATELAQDVLSLPLRPDLTEDETGVVIEAVNSWV